MIIYEKYDKHNNELPAWRNVFADVNELLEFMNKHKDYLLGIMPGNKCSILIKEVKK
jgi:hypothetical protein